MILSALLRKALFSIILFLPILTYSQREFKILLPRDYWTSNTQRPIIIGCGNGQFTVVAAQPFPNKYNRYSIRIARFRPDLKNIWSIEINPKAFEDPFYLVFKRQEEVYATRTKDDGILLAYTNYDFFQSCLLTKINASGRILWTRKVHSGRIGWDVSGITCAETDEGEYLIGGQVDSLSRYLGTGTPLLRKSQGFAAKIAGNGKLVWSKAIPSVIQTPQYYVSQQPEYKISGQISKIIPTKNKGALILAKGPSSLCQLDSIGQISWYWHTGKYGGTSDHEIYDVILDTVGNIYGTGWYDGDTNAVYWKPHTFIFKLNSKGNPQWLYHYTDSLGEGKNRFAKSISVINDRLMVAVDGGYSGVSFLSTDFSGFPVKGTWYPYLHDWGYSGNFERHSFGYDDYTHGLFTKDADGIYFHATQELSPGFSSSLVLKVGLDGRGGCGEVNLPFTRNNCTSFFTFQVLGQSADGFKVSDTSILINEIKTPREILCSDRFYPQAWLGNDTVLCEKKPFALNAGQNYPGCKYLWNTGDTVPQITVNNAGQYWIQIKLDTIIVSDTVNVVYFVNIKKFQKHKYLTCPNDSVYLRAPEIVPHLEWLKPRGILDRRLGFWAKDSGWYYLRLYNAVTCSVIDSLHIGYYSLPNACAGPDTLLCYNQSYTMQGKGGITYHWIPAKYLSNDTIANPVASPPGTQKYILIVKNAFGCADTSEVWLKVRPQLHVKVQSPSQINCAGDPVMVYATATGGNAKGYKYKWSAGSSTDSFITIRPFTSGWYKVALNDGCSEPAADSMYITVPPRPKAAFVAVPAIALVEKEIQFQNKSKNATGYSWDFGDGNNSAAFSPNHKYEDTGYYSVTLRAVNSQGCSDTVTSIVRVIDNPRIHIPNVFTPNDDRINDRFVIVTTGISSIEYSIYNRWGERIFTSSASGPEWNGAVNNRGPVVPEGVYLYTLAARDYLGFGYYLSGTVQVMR